MFLKKVYRYHKLMGIGMLFFVLVQAFCFYKGAMVFSPWYNYGMFSHKIVIDSVYSVNKVGNLKGSDFNPQMWDKIHWTFAQYQLNWQNDSLYEKDIKRIFLKGHLPAPSKINYVNGEKLTVESFAGWYQAYLLRRVPGAGNVIKTDSSKYVWNGNVLVPLIKNAQ